MHPILQEFTRKRVLAYARSIPEEGALGPVLFPAVTTNELTFEYWRELNLLPVSASLQPYGAEAQIGSRDGAAKVSGEIPPIKRKINLDERNLLALKREGAGDIPMVRDTLYNDIRSMVQGVQTRIEALRIMAMATGQLVLNENGVILNVNYGVPGAHQVTLTGGVDTWDFVAGRDIVGNMQTWANIVQGNTGIRPTRAVTSDTVINFMLQDQAIREMIWGPVGDMRPVTLGQINGLLQSMDLPQVGSYNRRYRVQNEAGAFNIQRFFPQDRFVMLPPTRLGDTLMGPTAEALLDDNVEANLIAGIYATVEHENEPPMIWTKASATSLPTFPAADLVFQAVVLP